MSSNKDLSQLAKNIRKLREKRSFSRNKLSKLTNMNCNTTIKIDSGLIKSPKIETVQNIVDAFGISLDELTK